MDPSPGHLVSIAQESERDEQRETYEKRERERHEGRERRMRRETETKGQSARDAPVCTFRTLPCVPSKRPCVM